MEDETRVGAEKAPQAECAAFDVKLLEVLACPISKLPLCYDPEAQELISEKAGVAYPIREGVAVLVASEARRING